MSNLSWWRSWHGAPMDHKWSVIAARSGVKPGVVSAVMWVLLDYASQQDDRGSVAGFDTEEYAIYSGFPQAEIDAVMVAMNEKGIIKDGRLVNWEKRQPKREDDSTERVRKFRETKRNVTQGNTINVEETPQIKIKIKDTDKEREEEEEEHFGDFKTANFADYGIRVWARVTGMVTIPGSESDKVIPAMDALYCQMGYNEDRLAEYLKPYWERWKTMRGKNGAPFKKTNAAWLYDWAVSGEDVNQIANFPRSNGATKTKQQLIQERSDEAVRRVMEKIKNGDAT